jgi:hypothetical protein
MADTQSKRAIVARFPAVPPITFLPGFASLIPKRFAKVFTNERVRVEMSGITRIFSR